MKAFTFQAPPNILFEAGASKKLAELVAGYGAKRVLLVTDKGVRNAGLTKNAEAGLVSERLRTDGIRRRRGGSAIAYHRAGGRALPRQGDRTGCLDRRRQCARYGEARGLSRQDA